MPFEPFELKVALRYLLSSRMQTVLILAGVAIGIVAYTFMAALINGLAVRLTDNVIGNFAHITLEKVERQPGLLEPATDGTRTLLAVQRANDRQAEIRGYPPILDAVAALPGVIAVSPQVTGNGFFQRGEKILAVGITGLDPSRISAILDLEGSLVRGTARLGPGDVLVGVKLADELGVTTGQRLRLRSDRQRERTVTIRGIFDVGSAAANERLAFVDLRTAQSLLDLDGALSKIEIKIVDIYRAREVADRLAAMTGLEAKDWISENQRLQDALRAQGTTGDLIKFFSLLTIIIGVASVLLLATMRRRAEIGIMRGMGVSSGSVRRIFQLQGFLIGFFGSTLGAFFGWLFCILLLELGRRPDGSSALPVDPALGEYGTAILLATLASTLASILPARAASKIDPVEAIQQ